MLFKTVQIEISTLTLELAKSVSIHLQLKGDALKRINFYQHAQVGSSQPMLKQEQGKETIGLVEDVWHCCAQNSQVLCFGMELKPLFLEKEEHS